MARKSIFEKLESRWDLSDEVSRICRLVHEIKSISYGEESFYTVEQFVNNWCLFDWKNRGHCLGLKDFLEALDYGNLLKKARTDEESFLEFIEIVYNLFELAGTKINAFSNSVTCEYEFYILQELMDDCLEHYNQMAYYNEEKEQVLIIEKDSAVTSVVETEENDDIAFDIIRYNYHTLKGDIELKKSILLKLGSQLEPERSTLLNLNRTLTQDIFNLLNKLNIRHNNCAPGKKYEPVTASMSPDELEGWYDELYQMILLAKLELANIERANKVKDLISKF